MKRHYLAITIKNIIYINFITVFIFQFFFFITSAYSESLTSWDNMDLKNSYGFFHENASIKTGVSALAWWVENIVSNTKVKKLKEKLFILLKILFI